MTFSIRYDGKKENDSGYIDHAVDWDWGEERQWARSDKRGPGEKWSVTPGLDEKAYGAILRHFGLEDYRDQLPLEVIITVGPYELGRLRREKERVQGLEYLEIRSDTLGDETMIP